MAKALTLYDLLEASPQASQEAIQSSYERLKSKYLEGQLQSGKLDADTHFNLIKDAFQTLSNPTARNRYDARLEPAAETKNPTIIYSEPAYQSEGSYGWKWGLIAVIGICAGYYFYSQHQIASEVLRMAAEAQRIQHEEAAHTKEAQEEAQRLQTSTLQQRQEEAAASRMRADLARESAQIDNNLANANRQAQYDADRQRQQEENKRRQETYEAQRRIEHERTLARQLEYENRSGSPRAASISARH